MGKHPLFALAAQGATQSLAHAQPYGGTAAFDEPPQCVFPKGVPVRCDGIYTPTTLPCVPYKGQTTDLFFQAYPIVWPPLPVDTRN